MKTAFVTGGNRGIGRAIAEGLIEKGLKVMIGCRDAEQGAEIADQIGAEFVYCDLSFIGSHPYKRLAAPTEVENADILINNAGVLFDKPMFEDRDGFGESMDVMLHGPYELIRKSIPWMTQKGYGRIVNVSSDWGSFSQGLGGGGAYAVAKAALNALTVIAARDLPDSIKINSMCPGWAQTRMGGARATRTVKDAADTAIWLATLPDDGPTGGFFRDRKPFDW